jgi:hypothetical protein
MFATAVPPRTVESPSGSVKPPFSMNIVYVRQQFESFAAVGAIAQARWSLGAKSVDVSQVSFKSITIKKQKGIEG